MAYEYKATVTYIAEMVGLTTGKKIYLKGAWSGVSVKESQIVLENDGTLVRRIIRCTQKCKLIFDYYDL